MDTTYDKYYKYKNKYMFNSHLNNIKTKINNAKNDDDVADIKNLVNNFMCKCFNFPMNKNNNYNSIQEYIKNINNLNDLETNKTNILELIKNIGMCYCYNNTTKINDNNNNVDIDTIVKNITDSYTDFRKKEIKELSEKMNKLIKMHKELEIIVNNMIDKNADKKPDERIKKIIRELDKQFKKVEAEMHHEIFKTSNISTILRNQKFF